MLPYTIFKALDIIFYTVYLGDRPIGEALKRAAKMGIDRSKPRCKPWKLLFQCRKKKGDGKDLAVLFSNLFVFLPIFFLNKHSDKISKVA